MSQITVWQRLSGNNPQLAQEIESKPELQPLKILFNDMTLDSFNQEDKKSILESFQGIPRFYLSKNRSIIKSAVKYPSSWGEIINFRGLSPTITAVREKLQKRNIRQFGVLDLSRGNLTQEDLIDITDMAKDVDHIFVLDLSFNRLSDESSLSYPSKSILFLFEKMAAAWRDKVEFILLHGCGVWNHDFKPPFLTRSEFFLDGLDIDSRNHHIRYKHSLRNK